MNHCLQYVEITERDKKRWNLIKPYIKENEVVIDFGSAIGFFSKKISEMGNLVFSIESEKDLVAKQIRENKDNRNLLISNKRFKLKDFQDLEKVPETIDTILMLSVIHHFDEDWFEVLKIVSKLARKLIIEFPAENEKPAVNSHLCPFMNKVNLKGLFDHVEEIAKVKSHLGNYYRSIFYCENKTFKRTGLENYIGYKEAAGALTTDLFVSRLKRLEFKRNHWYLNDKKIFRGLNLSNLFKLGLVHPTRDTLFEKIKSAYDQKLKTYDVVTDVRLWNCIITKNGVEAIDFKEKLDSLTFNGYGIIQDQLFSKSADDQQENKDIDLQHLFQKEDIDLEEVLAFVRDCNMSTLKEEERSKFFLDIADLTLQKLSLDSFHLLVNHYKKMILGSEKAFKKDLYLLKLRYYLKNKIIVKDLKDLSLFEEEDFLFRNDFLGGIITELEEISSSNILYPKILLKILKVIAEYYKEKNMQKYHIYQFRSIVAKIEKDADFLKIHDLTDLLKQFAVQKSFLETKLLLTDENTEVLGIQSKIQQLYKEMLA
jgi:hypothetical protein